MKILLCSSEVVPFAKTGGLADVAGSLPKALASLGHDVRIVMPKYASVDEKRFNARKTNDNLRVLLAGREEKAALWTSEVGPGVTACFVDNPALYGDGPLYGHANDPERFIFYQRAVMEMLAAGDWKPDVVHCNDWQTGLLPLYIQRQREAAAGGLGDIATVYTIHNLAYQGLAPKDALSLAGLPDSYFTMDKLEFYDRVNFMKAGILYTDIISTVSPTYAKEIQTLEYGEQLDGVLTKRSDRLRGIINGIDCEVWNPQQDAFLAAKYHAGETKGKSACKKALQERLKLPKAHVPVIALVTRLAAQKGLDILEDILPYLLKLKVQLVVLGVGEKHYEELMTRAAQEFPDQVSITLQFNEELAHQIYAGADMFLMPSRYEPCGLGQMIALRYGTVPIVRETGGLADTVVDFDIPGDTGNGFTFTGYSGVALLTAIARALLVYRSKSDWQQLVEHGLSADFSWQASAKKYEGIYQEAINLRK